MQNNRCNQSPICVVPNVVSRLPLRLDLDWLCVNGNPSWDGGHGLKVSFPYDPNNKVVLDGVDFILDHFHFHKPSEHHLKGQKYCAELHIVHLTPDQQKAVVIAVFLAISDKPHDDLDAGFFEALADQSKQPARVPLNPYKWLPPHTNTAIRYEGSLTTGDYKEIVSWTILGVLHITQDQFSFIFRNTANHARELQNLNRRYLVEYPWNPVIPK